MTAVPKLKFEDLIARIHKSYHENKCTEIKLNSLKRDAMSISKADIGRGQVCWGLIEALEGKDKETIRSRYKHAISCYDDFGTHQNFIMAFEKIYDFKSEESAFLAAYEKLDNSNIKQLGYLNSFAFSRGYMKISLELIESLKKLGKIEPIWDKQMEAFQYLMVDCGIQESVVKKAIQIVLKTVESFKIAIQKASVEKINQDDSFVSYNIFIEADEQKIFDVQEQVYDNLIDYELNDGVNLSDLSFNIRAYR